MIDVTVLFLERGHASTATGPLEVFRDAGVLWNVLRDEAAAPRFRVRSASIGGRAVRPDAPYTIRPDLSLDAIERTDLVFVPSAGLGLDELLARNAPVIEFLRRVRAGGAQIASVCSGVALPAAAGLLDGRRATTHWGLVDEYRARFPDADWRPEELITASDGIYCGARRLRRPRSRALPGGDALRPGARRPVLEEPADRDAPRLPDGLRRAAGRQVPTPTERSSARRTGSIATAARSSASRRSPASSA